MLCKWKRTWPTTYASKATPSWVALEGIRISPGGEGLNYHFLHKATSKVRELFASPRRVCPTADTANPSFHLRQGYDVTSRLIGYRCEFREAYVSLKECRLFKAPAGENNNWQGHDH